VEEFEEVDETTSLLNQSNESFWTGVNRQAEHRSGIWDDHCVILFIMFMIKIFKWILIKVHLQIIGAWKICQEQIWDRHKNLPTDLPSQAGKNLVITGGNRGLGYEAVKKLIKSGFHVILGVRRPKELHEKLTEENITEGTFEALELDTSSLESVKSFAEKVLEKNYQIHVLINNAGIMFGPRKESTGGFEMQLATNHLGHFLLTHLLLPKLKESGRKESCSRIINVSSCAHYGGCWLNWEDLQSEQFYSPSGAYCTSKAAQVMMTLYLNQKLNSLENSNVKVFVLHPGVVKTDLYVNEKWLTVLMGFLMKTPEQGGDTLVHAAVGPDLENTDGGLYLENSQAYTPSSFCRNLENQLKLWNKSCELCGIEEFFQ